MKHLFSLLLISLIMTSCGKKDEAEQIREDAKKDLKKKYPCSQVADLKGEYTDGQETIFINIDCSVTTLTCDQKGTLTKVTSNSFTLTLSQSHDAACLSGTHDCSYSFTNNRSVINATCGQTTLSYTRR
jgi:hypothetical protein